MHFITYMEMSGTSYTMPCKINSYANETMERAARKISDIAMQP